MARTGHTQQLSLDRALDEVIEKLGARDQVPHVRALLIEARRLKSIIANWRSIPPLPEVREEMIARVLHVASAAGESVQIAPAAPPSVSSGTTSTALVAPRPAPYIDEIPASEGPGEVTIITEGQQALPQTPLNVVVGKPPERPDPNLVMLAEPYGLRADRYRALRHRLGATGDPRIIAVTSAGRDEGKTTCAINLALALREGARGRVLLLEGNLRSPSIAKYLGFLPPECLSVQLRAHRQDPLLPWTPVEQVAPLHVLAVNPTEERAPILDPIAFSIAIDRLRFAGYDYIVVDTPPVLESADVNLISDSVDGVLLVARAKRSRAKAMHAALEQLRPTPVLGAVLLY